MKGILNKNGDLSVKGIILVVLIAILLAGALDGAANLYRAMYTQSDTESGVYGYMAAYVHTGETTTNSAVPLELRDEDDVIAEPHVHVYPVKKVTKVVAKEP